MDNIQNEIPIDNELQNENQSQQSPNRSKSKIILLVLVLSLIVFLVIFVMYKVKKNVQVQEKVSNLQVEVLGNLTEKDIDILADPVKQKMLKDKQDECDFQVEDKRVECLEMLRSLQVTFLEDEELCEQLDAQKDQCFKNLAINKNDLDICNRIEIESLKQFCSDSIYQVQALEDSDLELCSKIQDSSQKEMCQKSIFKQVADIEMCDSEYIINNSLEEQCQSITLLQKAIFRKSVNICEQIPIMSYQQECLESI
jgi:hypothetical protein